MNAELKRRILSDSGIGVPFAQTKILNLNLEYAMTTRVIALDLDGTLLTPKKTLLPSSIEALARAREAGYQLIIVTGRHHVAIHPFYQALALDTPAICCNGTYLYDYHAKTVLEADPMPVNKALQLIEMLNEHHIHGLMYVDDAMSMSTRPGMSFARLTGRKPCRRNSVRLSHKSLLWLKRRNKLTPYGSSP